MLVGAQPINDVNIKPLTERKAWKALETHHRQVRGLHLRELFAADPERGERLTAEALDIFLDFAKNRITDETLNILIQLADESGSQVRIDAMFRGEKINGVLGHDSSTNHLIRRYRNLRETHYDHRV